MQRYAKKLVNDMNSMTSKSYKVMDFDVKVSFELLPSDMKWLAFMGGELSNAAFYFSPFGNVNDDIKSTVNGTLGKGSQNTWQPWNYDKHLKTAAKVSNLKQQLQEQSYAESTKRKKVLDFIRDQKSRQEFEPLTGPMIDVGYAEPLHNGNNKWQFWHSFVLELALGKSRLPGGCNELDKLPADSPFLCYLNCLRNNFGLTRLVKKRSKSGSQRGGKKLLTSDLRAKRPRKMFHKYMLLLDCISRESDPPETKLKIGTLAYCVEMLCPCFLGLKLQKTR